MRVSGNVGVCTNGHRRLICCRLPSSVESFELKAIRDQKLKGAKGAYKSDALRNWYSFENYDIN